MQLTTSDPLTVAPSYWIRPSSCIFAFTAEIFVLTDAVRTFPLDKSTIAIDTNTQVSTKLNPIRKPEFTESLKNKPPFKLRC